MKILNLSIIIVITLILSLFLSPFPASSQTKKTGLILLGKYRIIYDQSFRDDTNEDGIIDKVSYFTKGSLVLTIWDNNQDGKPDAWFSYDEEEYLIMQAEDLDGDGNPDRFLHFDREERLTKREENEEIGEVLLTENPFLPPQPVVPKEEVPAYTFISDHEQIALTISDLTLEEKESGELAWILTLIMKAEINLRLYATEYWFIYPDCPGEDVYTSGDLEGISYQYLYDPKRNYEKIFSEYQEKWYYPGEEVSRRFTLPLCMEAYFYYDTTRVDLVQAVEYYLTDEDRVETLEWEFSSP